MKIRITLSLFFLTLLTSCNVNKSVIGKYRSNFAQLGFFITEIKLNTDNTFHYEQSGDLQYTELEGKYTIKSNKLYLRFNKLKGETDEDAIKIVGKDTIVDFEKVMNSHSYELKKENELEYHLKYKISKGKLLAYHIQTNKLVKKAKTYSDKRKYYKKKYFLKKIEE
ncbi:hypothetical protein LZZ90_10825 [Flavobacterium sp. SM15]|uniref:hypothetical protein n=1 Tax=Flavobacterium sp. SM15 TaxID=2908005 RepID=UPI001ED9FE03|nr:hypothetical protein [Flavobacterium sp. SM15]MCG2612000.1 hypothetical protein [Flavobacterium sp. SM15]